jgi:hypothetical protein
LPAASASTRARSAGARSGARLRVAVGLAGREHRRVRAARLGSRVVEAPQQCVQAEERHVELRLHAAGREDAHPAGGGVASGGGDQRRLADAGLPAQHQGAAGRFGGGAEPVHQGRQLRELSVAAPQSVPRHGRRF